MLRWLREIASSLSEYASRILHHWVVILIFVINAVCFAIDAAGIVLQLKIQLTIPIQVWVAVALVSLVIAQFLAFHGLREQRDKLKKQLDDKSRKRAIREALGEFLEEGRLLQRQCGNERETPPNEEADDWAARTEAYLSEHRGQSYVSRFRSGAGLPMTMNSIASVPHRNVWGYIHIRLSRLQQFIAELTD